MVNVMNKCLGGGDDEDDGAGNVTGHRRNGDANKERVLHANDRAFNLQFKYAVSAAALGALLLLYVARSRNVLL